MGTAVPLVFERVMSQSLNSQKKKKKRGGGGIFFNIL
jgi:hypothetical protein